MAKKELLARSLHLVGGLPIMRRFITWNDDELRILAYHRILDVSDVLAFPYDPDLISASTAQFRHQIEHVATSFEPITCADVLAAMDGGRVLPRRSVIITFDDGHADNYSHAFPVLRQMGVPATIFLSTGYIGKAGTFWFDRVANILFRAPTGSYVIPGLKTPIQVTDVPSRRLAGVAILKYLKSLANTQRIELISVLTEVLKASNFHGDEAFSGAMTWSQVQEMAAAGIEFGSHSVSHPILTQLDDDMLDYELVESRAIIARQTGQPVDIIAYPNGGPEAFDQRVISAAMRAGYRLGFTYISGSNRMDRLNKYAMERLHVESYTSRARFQAMLEFPSLFR